MRVRNPILIFVAFAMAIAMSFGCGSEGIGSSDGNELGQRPAPSGAGQGDFWIDLIHSRHYSGTILVEFKDGTGIRYRDDVFVSDSDDVSSINSAIAESSAAILRALPSSEEEIASAVESARKNGAEFQDWNLVYRIKVEDEVEAEEIYLNLRSNPLVKNIYPLPHVYTSNVTSDISGDQAYLKSNSQTGGLNVEEAWGESTGSGVIVVDSEPNWNFNHEDLPIDVDDVVYNPPGQWDPVYDEQNYIQHGTAVIGIIGGLDNGLGIKGLAHGSSVRVAHTDSLTSGPIGTFNTALEKYNNGTKDDATLYEGDIIVIEGQVIGPTTGDLKCSDYFSGCLPIEAYTSAFEAITEATSLGIVVIEGAGNGYVDLDTPAGHIQGGPDLSNFTPYSENDSGAIVVGATMGPAHDKAIFSNCGSRVNVNAWGAGVATTGWHSSWGAIHPASDPNDPNKYYTGSFGGTSSATAIIAGAAALIQSKAREMYGHNPPYKWVYLDSFQMRELLIESGKATPAMPGTHPLDPIPNCNVGNQPDVVKAIQLLEDGFIVPKIKYKSQTVIKGTSAKKLDIDGDARGDLIVNRNGGWHVDLSSIGPGGDNFGGDTWDLTIDMGDDDPDGEDDVTQPVVADYDSDGFTDLALYGIKNGKWYIAYNDEAMRESGAWHGWDKIVDYSTDPNWKAYSRPVHGDYDGDGWMDLALQTPDGYWLIDYALFETKMDPDTGVPYLDPEEGWDGFVDYADDPATPDKDETRKGIVKYLTDEQLQAAPGWSYLPLIYSTTYIGGGIDIMYKVPDGSEDVGKIFGLMPPLFTSSIDPNPPQPVFNGNEEIFVPAKYVGYYEVGVKRSDGEYKVAADDGWDGWHDLGVDGVFGGIECKPVPADYDGDGKDDRAVYCGLNEWRIAYSSDVYSSQMSNGLRTIITQKPYARPFPPVVYSGGTALQEIAEYFDIWTMKPPVLPTFNDCFDYWAHWSPKGPVNIDGCAH